MKNLSSKIVLAFSSVALVGAMYACSSPTIPYTPSEDEEAATSPDDEGAESSSSKAEVKSSSSAAADEKSSSSEAAETPESSSAESGDDPESSSSVVVETDVGVLDTAKTEVPTKVDTKKDEVVSITPEKIEESMTKVKDDELPEGITEDTKLEGDDLFVQKDELDFGSNEYYCKTPDGDWYVLEGSKYDSVWAKIVNWISWMVTGKKWLDYSKVCDVIYVHPNK